MARGKKIRVSQQVDVANLQPDELNALKALVKEFIGKVETVENEILTLKEDRKEIIEEYAEKLDTKTLAMALQVIKISSRVERKDSFDLFLEVLTEA